MEPNQLIESLNYIADCKKQAGHEIKQILLRLEKETFSRVTSVNLYTVPRGSGAVVEGLISVYINSDSSALLMN